MKNYVPTQNVLQKLLLLLAMLVPGGSLLAQQTITGTITGEDGEPLIGATVTVKGTTIGTIADVEGRYGVQVSPEAETLIFSFVGMETQEIPIEDRNVIDMVMNPDVTGLEEVVVIGYGSRKKVNLTGSVASIETKDLALNPTGNVTQSLQGMAPGVEVTTSNTPGSDAKIRIRGLGTINNNNPLWVIDGVPTFGGINEINPAEIASMNILKDAASTAIYGARGANGVILVTTLQGKKGQAPQVKLNVRHGLVRNTQKHDMLDVDEFGEMLWLQSRNSGVDPTHPIYGSGAEPRVPRYLIPAGADQADLSLYDITDNPITEANAAGTDWYDEIYNPGMSQEYTLAVTGGSENTTYGFSAGFLDEEGIVKKTGFKRYTFRSNISSDLTPWLEVGQHVGISYTNNYGYQSEGGSNSPFGQLLELTAIMPVYDVMGNYAAVSRIIGLQANNNPVASN